MGPSRAANSRKAPEKDTGIDTDTNTDETPTSHSNVGVTEPRPDRDRAASALTSYVTSASIASGLKTYGSDWDSWMNRPYTAQSPYSLTPTERVRSSRKGRRYAGGHDADRYEDLDGDYGDRHTNLDTDVLPPYPGDDYDDLGTDDFGTDDLGTDDLGPDDLGPDEYSPHEYGTDEYDYRDEAHIDRRWMWIAGIAGAILFVSVITASLILGGGDSGSVSGTIVATDASAAPIPSATAQPSAPSVAAAPAMPSMPAETVTTVTPAPSPTAQIPAAQPLLPAPQAAPPVSAVPGTVTYRITGDRRLIDLVTIIYTDQQGALVTDLNVALPWTKTLVLNPGVALTSVTATSIAGQLNCSISDANGALIAAQNNNSIITSCTR